MKVLIIFPRVPYPHRDGGAIAMHQMIKGLFGQGLDLTLFFLNTSKHYIEHDIIRQQYGEYGDVHVEDIENKITVLGACCNLFTNGSYHITRFDDEQVHRVLSTLVKGGDFDVIHFEGLQTTPYLETIKKLNKGKCVLRQHNIEHLIWERNAENSSFLKGKYLKLLASRLKKYELDILSKADAIVSISDVDTVFFKKHNKNVYTATTGVSVVDVVNIPVETRSVCYLGSMDWMPNQEGVKWFLSKVWEEVLSKDPEFKFYLAGRNFPKYFFELEKKYKNVKVIGEVENAVDFLASKEILIVPLWAGSGVRIKILEGMSLGKYVVTTTIGAEGIPVVDKENIRIEDEVKLFAEAIVNKESYSDISNNAKAFIREKFDNNVISQGLIRFYQNIE